MNARREIKYFFLFTSISMIGFLTFYLYPILRTIYLSFTNRQITSPNYTWTGLDNYRRALFDDNILHHALMQTFKFAIVVGPLSITISLLIALLLNNKLKGMGLFRTIFFMPFIIPAFAVAYVFQWFFQPTNGMVNGILAYVGIAGPGWHTHSETALLTLMITSLWGFGVTMIIFLAALQGVPKELYEVAEIDGATRYRKFWSVTFPAISPVFLFNSILTTIGALKSFDLAFMMGKGEGYPAGSTLLYSVYLFGQAFQPPYRLGYASAIALLFFLVVLVLTAFNFLIGKYYVKSESK